MIKNCSCLPKSLRSERLEILRCCRLLCQAVGGEENVMVNVINDVLLGEPSFVIIHHLQEICIVKQEQLNLDVKLSLRALM